MSQAICYEPRAVCFMDILGFKCKIEESVNNPALVATLGKIVKSAMEYTNQQKSTPDAFMHSTASQKFGAEVVHFSDSIVLSVSRVDIEGLIWLFNTVIAIGERLIFAGLPVRGGVTFGQVYHSKDIIFGPAMVKAYELESKFAQVPRIIISSELLKKIEQEDVEEHLACNFISSDQDYSYIDYIRKNSSVADYNDILTYMKALQVTIQLGLSHKDISVVGKYEWMRRVFNDMLRDFHVKNQQADVLSHIKQDLKYLEEKFKPID